MRRSRSRTSATERGAIALLFLALAAGAAAQSVALSGTFGEKALLVIDGKPKTLGVGEQQGGVRLVGVSAGEAVVEVGGKREMAAAALGLSDKSLYLALKDHIAFQRETAPAKG